MVDRRFEDVENLLRGTVFHPSPQRQLRERVLHTAARAHRRQVVGRRALSLGAGALAAASLAALIGWYVARPPAGYTGASSRAQIHATPSQPPLSGQLNPAASGTGQSIGETLFRGDASRQPAATPAPLGGQGNERSDLSPP